MVKARDQSSHTRMTLSKIEKYHSAGKYWDVQIRVENKVFKCLRAVLAANSEYFDTMFSSNFEESNFTPDQPITLHDMDASAFGELLRFIYTGDISVNEFNVLQLLFMNDFFRLCSGHVKKKCLGYVKRRSQVDEPMIDAPDLLCFARLKEDKVLVDTLHAHICRYLYHYSKDAKLMEISFEKLNALLEFSKNYVVPLRGSADVLLKIVRTWINHDRAGRSQYRSKFMKNIDFANISSDFAASLVNMLDCAVDEVAVNLSKDVEPLSILKMLTLGATNLADTADEFDGIISFNFKNVSEMQIGELTLSSSSCIIFGVSWKIGIQRPGNDDALGMYLSCHGAEFTADWNCYASSTFTIVSPKERGYDFVRTFRFALFTSNKMPCAWGPRIKWDDLTDSAKGYLNDDDSITLTVNVYADVPFLMK